MTAEDAIGPRRSDANVEVFEVLTTVSGPPGRQPVSDVSVDPA